MIFIIYTICVLAAMLTSCSDGELPLTHQEHSPILFSSIQQEEQTVTRAGNPLGRDFIVWGYKSFESASTQLVFPGYWMTYVVGSGGSSTDNSYGYSYVDPTHNQEIKYWDFEASEYCFWGATMNSSNPDDPNNPTFSSDGSTLTISNLQQTVTEPYLRNKLFSARYHRCPVTNMVVQLEFKRPMSQVKIMFFSGETLEDGDQIEITDISLGPQSPEKIITGGTLTVSYPKNGDARETYAISNTTEGEYWTYDNVQLTHTHGTASNNAAVAVPTGGEEYYFVVPYKYTTPFTLYTTVEGDAKTASVPVELMNWMPNYTYTYIFKITETGKKIEFYDVKIEPWKYGGSQEEEWKNW